MRYGRQHASAKSEIFKNPHVNPPGVDFTADRKTAACTAERFTEMRKLHKNQPPNEKLFEDLQETKMLEEIRGRK